LRQGKIRGSGIGGVWGTHAKAGRRPRPIGANLAPPLLPAGSPAPAPPSHTASTPSPLPQDHNPNAWFTADGKRLGNYIGHNGAVATCDVSLDSSLLLTGSADSSAKLWDVRTGACHFTWSFDAPCKAVAFGLGDGLAAISTDPFLSKEPAIHIVRVSGASQAAPDILASLTGFKGRINRVAFTDGNASLLAAGEDGVVRRWDVEAGAVIDEAPLHKGSITDLQLSADGTHFVTSSLDTTAKLVDARTLKELKEYKTGTNANAAALHPAFPHILVGGGQEASQVTTTSSRAGKFESRFFHKVLADEVGTVRGHFGPINAVAFSPDGRAFATGGEDGYIRLHHFDPDYLRIGAAHAKDVGVLA
jgi:translation initiation factor 3 subunit I